jgi:GT2 family glycosyltransferase
VWNADSHNPPTLRLQIVLYENDLTQLRGSVAAAANSLCNANLEEWHLLVGDCSPSPLLDQRVIEHFSEYAQGLGGTFEYRFFNENLGHGGGHNLLNEGCKEDLTLILNPDGVLAPDTVSALVAALKPGVGIVDARQLPMEHPKQYDPITGEASWSSLSCAITPSALFFKLGGIDHETFHMYCDDVDYSWRVRLAGYSAIYCPQARMFHDKRIDRFGVFQASETEKYSSAEAALLLAYKYSRLDIVTILEKAMAESGDQYQLKAVAEFKSRCASGKLPVQLDVDNKVAEFTGGVYGAHRF